MTGQELIDWIREYQAEGLRFYKFTVDDELDIIEEDIDPAIVNEDRMIL